MGYAQVFLTRLNEQQAGNMPAGWSYVLPTESQWEYACRRNNHGIFMGDSIAGTNANYSSSGYSQTVMWGCTPPILGFFICTKMCGSGPRIGTSLLTPPATWWSTRPPSSARIESYEVVPGATVGRPCVLLSAAPTPPATVAATQASVLVSKKASEGKSED